jgi:tRNA(Ile)-lysidine synthase
MVGPLQGLKLCVAFSGGMDSCALLVALAAIRRREQFGLRAVHVNHQLQPQAAQWARAARAVSRQLQVSCRVLTVTVASDTGESLEAAAREARYGALGDELAPDELLLTAHHEEDQLETVLLALMRGSGVRGLSAMAAMVSIGRLRLLRPLLPVARAQLQSFLMRRRIAWSEDPSNADQRFDRNYLRHAVVPLLRARWPAAAASASRSAAHLMEAGLLLEQVAADALSPARDGAALRVSALRRLPLPARHNALRHWIAAQRLPLPDQNRLREMAGPLLSARQDATPCVRWRGAQVRRHGDRLFATTAEAGRAVAHTDGSLALHRWDWRTQRWLALPPDALGIVHDRHGDLNLAALPAQLTVCFRQGGERLRAHHGGAALKDLLQQAGIAPWQRSRVPLVMHAERIIAVADLWVDPAYRVSGDDAPPDRGRLRWRRADRGAPK